MRWAGEQALREAAYRDGGRYSWLSTTLSRWNLFCEFCKTKGIKDARNVSQETFISYARSLNYLSASSKQNYISSVNTALSLMSGGDWMSISPSQITQTRRCNVKFSPLHIPIKYFEMACNEISLEVGKNFELAVRFAYLFGLRRREALLLEFHLAYKQARNTGKADIVRGTKGGRSRSVPRILPVADVGLDVLKESCEAFPTSRCLLLSSSYKTVSSKLSAHALPILKKYGVQKFHDLRVDYAVFRYRELTGCDAPRNTSDRAIKAADQKARRIISLELGHSRPQILNSYIGAYR